jgi:cysteinyl-tRNA synthetase
VALRILNTQTHQKEDFVPLKPGRVTMYVCGPTVYDLLHIGNFRGPIFFNLVRNWLEKSGFKVEYAYNYTDVDDKIIQRANEVGMDPNELSAKYIAEFEKDFSAMGLKAHTHNPRVTNTMEPIKKLIGDLVEKGKAYVAKDGEVLYSVRGFAEYGKLSGRNIDELQSGSRVEVDPKKRDPLDFALWKPAKPGEPKWTSPWCDGRPGWHIECSAMVQDIFGDSIDIHGGGTDLIFPHHENEIAQSEGASGKPFARYWMHNAMLTFGDKKMSKSLGNIMSAREFLSKYDAEILKFMMLTVHYRSLCSFSAEAMSSAVGGLAKFYSALSLAEKIEAAGVAPGAVPAAFATCLKESEAQITEALNDDFNTPVMFAALYSAMKGFNSAVRAGAKVTPEFSAAAKAFRSFVLSQGELLALFQQPAQAYLRSLDDRLLEEKGLSRADVDAKVAARTEVRAAKDFKKSDELRDELVKLGIALYDSAQGTSWEVAK